MIRAYLPGFAGIGYGIMLSHMGYNILTKEYWIMMGFMIIFMLIGSFRN